MDLHLKQNLQNKKLVFSTIYNWCGGGGVATLTVLLRSHTSSLSTWFANANSEQRSFCLSLYCREWCAYKTGTHSASRYQLAFLSFPIYSQEFRCPTGNHEVNFACVGPDTNFGNYAPQWAEFTTVPFFNRNLFIFSTDRWSLRLPLQ